MKFHRSLLLLAGISVLLSVAFFYILYKSSSDKNGKGLTLVLGWIGWLGIMAFIVPLIVPSEKRAEWFSKEYGAGSLVLLLATVLAVIAGNGIAYSLTT